MARHKGKPRIYDSEVVGPHGMLGWFSKYAGVEQLEALVAVIKESKK